MKTRLHRLYKRKLPAAINVVDEHENDPIEMSVPSKYPEGEQPQDVDGFPEIDHGHMKKIEGSKDDEPKGAILAIEPTRHAAKKVAEALPNLKIEPSDLHVTLIYLGKDLSDETIEKIKDVTAHICDAHEPLKCKTQGLGIFDHTDEDEGGRPFYASVDAKGLAALRTDLESALLEAGVELPSEYDFTPHMTLGYVHPTRVSFIEGSPGVNWTSKEVVLMVGGKHTKFALGDSPEDEKLEKEAGGFGISLHEVTTPSKGQGFTDNPADNHESENFMEDPDLKLGSPKESKELDPSLGYQFQDQTTDMGNGQAVTKVTVLTTQGEQVAAANFIHRGNNLVPGYVVVEDDHQRRGIASAIYKHVEQATGKKVVPSSNQTPDGAALWNNPGRQFGQPQQADVEAPYSGFPGPIPVDEDADKRFDITRGANPDENGYTDVDGTRDGDSIPRNPAKEGPIYGR